MKDSRTYRVREFAELAGVTVRTLHFYDEAGLLKPERREWSRHRIYRQDDLLRLQQILSLKRMGFSLREIEALLANPAYDVRESLRIQKAAVDDEIRRLQAVSYGLSRALAALETSGDVEWDDVAAVIRGLTDADKTEWLRRYYPPEQWHWLTERATQMPPELVEASARAWETLIGDFRAKAALPPDHPDVQALAARMNRLVEMFTAGDPNIEAALRDAYRDVSAFPVRFDGHDQALHEFMGQALTIYREQRGTS